MAVLCIGVCIFLAAASAATAQTDPLQGPLTLPVEPQSACTRDTFFEATSTGHDCPDTLYNRRDAGEQELKRAAPAGHWQAFAALGVAAHA